MKATRRQLTHMHRRGWQWHSSLHYWWRERCAFDLTHVTPIQVGTAAQAMLVDAAVKRRWDEARQHAWPPELFGYADARH